MNWGCISFLARHYRASLHRQQDGFTGRLLSNRKISAGEKFAGNWLMDAQGHPTDDPAVLNQNPPGTLLPVGGLEYGHKGYNLALMIEALTGGLAGFGRADPRQGWGATVNITFYDIESFAGNKDFLRQMDEIATQCIDNPPRSGIGAVRLPGQAGQAKRTNQLRSGVRLHPDIAKSLASFYQQYGRTWPNPVR